MDGIQSLKERKENPAVRGGESATKHHAHDGEASD